MNSRRTVAHWLLLVLLWSIPVEGQTLLDRLSPCVRSDVTSTNIAVKGTHCRRIDRLRQLLENQAGSARIRGYHLAGARGDDAAWRALARSVTHPIAERSAAEDLALARILAPNVRKASVRPIVSRLAVSTSARLDPAEPLRRLSMEICLFALAWSQTPEAWQDLTLALDHEGALADASIDALLLHPPVPFERLLDPSTPRSEAWARLLGRSRQKAAIPALRQVLLDGAPQLRLAAAEALLRVGDDAILPLLERWRSDPQAPVEFSHLADKGPYELAASDRADEDVTVMWPAQGGSGKILDRVRSPSQIVPRLYTSPDRLEKHRLLTATLLCAFSGCIAPTIERDWLRTAATDKAAGLSFAASALLAKFEPKTLELRLRARDPATMRGAGWSLPYLDGTSPLLDSAAQILTHDGPRHGNHPFCGGLVQERIRTQMSKSWLLDAAHSNGPCAPLAAEALATRDDADLRMVLALLFWAPHPLMRAAIARGLAGSLDPSSAGLLVRRFAEEDDVRVRRAIVRSLGRRHSNLGRRLLLDASRFDPDPLVRSLADLGLNGVAPESRRGDPLDFGLDEVGSEQVGLPASANVGRKSVEPLVFSAPPAREGQEASTILVVVSGPDGGSMPVVADPFGLVLLPVAKRSLKVERFVR